jgi:hypothetical protein
VIKEEEVEKVVDLALERFIQSEIKSSWNSAS